MSLPDVASQCRELITNPSFVQDVTKKTKKKLELTVNVTTTTILKHLLET